MKGHFFSSVKRNMLSDFPQNLDVCSQEFLRMREADPMKPPSSIVVPLTMIQLSRHVFDIARRVEMREKRHKRKKKHRCRKRN